MLLEMKQSPKPGCPLLGLMLLLNIAAIYLGIS